MRVNRGTNEPKAPASSEEVLERLRKTLATLSPEQRRAAQHMLDSPADVGVTSMRKLAELADVTPNTYVRLAQAIGFDGYEALRELFRRRAREGGAAGGREQWLEKAVAAADAAGLGEGVRAAYENMDRLFGELDYAVLDRIAGEILNARATYVLGLGTLNPAAHVFASLARMGLDSVRATPDGGSLPADDLAHAGKGDVMVAMTFDPYRMDAIRTVEFAKSLGIKVVVLTDSWRCRRSRTRRTRCSCLSIRRAFSPRRWR